MSVWEKIQAFDKNVKVRIVVDWNSGGESGLDRSYLILILAIVDRRICEDIGKGWFTSNRLREEDE